MEGREFGVRDGHAEGIGGGIPLRIDREPGGGLAVRDALDAGLEGGERPAAPGPADDAEQAVLDLGPFAGARRQMMHLQGQARGGGEALPVRLPEPNPVAVAPSAVGHDPQVPAVGYWC